METTDVQQRSPKAHSRDSIALATILDRLGPNVSVQLLMADGTLLHANQASLDAVGTTLTDVIGLPFHATPWWPVNPHERQRLQAAMEDGLHGKPSRFEVHLQRADGRMTTADFTLNPVFDGAGKVAFLVPSACDTSGRHAERERISFLAEHDALTGLPNAHRMRQLLPQVIADARQLGRRPALLCIGMDHFNRINTALGLPAGDEVLRTMGTRIAACLEPGDLLARGNGDEFIVALAAPAAPDEACEQLVLLLQDTIAAPIVVEGREVVVTAGIGLASADADRADPDLLMRHAGIALEQAQRSGCGRSATYGRDRLDADPDHLALAAALRHAIERDQLHLVYQPQADLVTGRIVGVEALLRWQHPQFGLVPPERFLPIAEETGLGAAIGDWVIRSACRKAAAWQQPGWPGVRISVNVSAAQLQQADFVEGIERRLREAGLQPRRFGLEISENQLMARPDQAAARLRRLRALGVEVALGNFGTGHSSLACLRSLPLDVVKIDRSLIPGITAGAGALSITRAILAMAHCLGMKVVAEGVESAGQLELLAANHCDRVQGHFVGAPVAAGAIDDLLRVGRALLEPRRRHAPVRTLLVAIDDPVMLERIQRQVLLRFEEQLRVDTCRSGPDALERLRAGPVDVLLAAGNLPVLDGGTLLKLVKVLQPNTVRMMVLDAAELAAVADDPRQQDVFRYLSRGGVLDHLLQHLKAALDLTDRQRALRILDIAVDGAPYQPTPVERELRRLEELEPGLTAMQHGPDGELLMPQTLPTMPGDLWTSAAASLPAPSVLRR
ncbi:EAL domain-containing protein [Aquincola sp. S2]|uniref:EAL domain-containing protein n=1 Tax=Pseudaquabacterium terrae TaxID=2732868 RepID=A0ABX2ERM3_9BURK|nr:EAL domain-containing protein [Aquabacterium terrae]NRF71109.1 EAL domain-containing protein [Aquabacterium terrae]